MIFDFIRGGQILNNRIKEAKEVIRITIKYSLVLTLIIMAIKFKKGLDFIEVKNAFHYYMAEQNVKTNQPDKIIGIDTKTLRDFGFNIKNSNKNKTINSNKNVNNTGNNTTNNIVNALNAPKVEIKSIDIVNNRKFKDNKDKVSTFLQNSFVSFFIFYFITFFSIIVIFKVKGYLINQNEFLRGARIVPLKYLNKIVRKYNRKNKKKYIKKKGNKKYSYYKIANAIYPVGNETIHTIVTGASGTGKTVLITDLIDQIRKNGDRAIIYDRMGTFVSRFYNGEEIDGLIRRTQDDPNITPDRKEELYRQFNLKRDIILNPLDSRAPYWSIFNEARDKIDFDNIASALIPEKASNIDTFWNEAARTMFSSVANKMKESGNISNKELTNVLLKNRLTEAAKLAMGTEAQSIIDEANPKTALSVMAMLATNLKSLTVLRDQKIKTDENGEVKEEEEAFSIRKWIQGEEQEGFLFVSSRADRHETLKPLISTWLDIAINSLLSLKQSTNRKIWIIIDELPSLHYLPNLQTGLAEARQFGGCFVLSMQLMAQLEAIYGTQKARATSGLCRNRVILNTPDEDTAKWCSDNLGRAEIKEVKESQSFGHNDMKDGVSINTQDIQRNIVLSTEIMQLGNLNAYIKFGGDFPIALSKFEYRKFCEVADGYIERKQELITTTEEKIAEDKNSEEEQKNLNKDTNRNRENKDKVNENKQQKLGGFMGNSYIEGAEDKKNNDKKKKEADNNVKTENIEKEEKEKIKILDNQEIDPFEDLN